MWHYTSIHDVTAVIETIGQLTSCVMSEVAELPVLLTLVISLSVLVASLKS